MALSLKFRTDDALRWGSGIGHNLSAGEFDQNTYDIQVAINDLQTDRPQPNNIASITVTGSSMTVYLDDGTPIGPLPLPVLAFTYRGEWAVSTVYNPLDIFIVSGVGLYLTRVLHTSDATSFDADALGSAVTAGSFVLNATYVIATVGTTDFTLIGANSNTVGEEFIATGIGSGTGTAQPRIYQLMIAVGTVFTSAYEVPTEGGTMTALASEKRRIIDPATPLDALVLVLPASPQDNDDYELITSETVTLLTADPAGTETVAANATGFVLSGRAKWTYRAANTTWYGGPESGGGGGTASFAPAYWAPTNTGLDYVAAAGDTGLVIQPAGAGFTLTLTLPPSPTDNQLYDLRTTQTINSLTISADGGGGEGILGGGPFILPANGRASWVFLASQNAWFGGM